jgi:hypothetical protein
MPDLMRWFGKKGGKSMPSTASDEKLRRKYGAYRRLLAADQEALEILTDLEEKYHGEYLFDLQYLRSPSKGPFGKDRRPHPQSGRHHRLQISPSSKASSTACTGN